MTNAKFLIVLVAVIGSTPCATAAAISISKGYFSFNGQQAKLAGYGFYGAVADRDFDFRSYLKKQADAGVNYVRLWDHFQWPQDGLMHKKGKYRITDQNNSLATRIRRFVKMADNLGIAVEVVLGPETVGIEDEANRWDTSWANPQNVSKRSKKHLAHLDRVSETTRLNRFFNLNRKKAASLFETAVAPAVTQIAETLAPFRNVLYGISQELEEDGVLKDRAVLSYTKEMANTVYNAVKDSNPDPVFVFNVKTKGSPLYDWATGAGASQGWQAVIRDHIHGVSEIDVWSGDEAHALILSNDGDLDTMYVDPSLSPADRKQARRTRRIEAGLLAKAAFEVADAFEFLDKNFWGDSWGSLKYEASNQYYSERIAGKVVSASRIGSSAFAEAWDPLTFPLEPRLSDPAALVPEPGSCIAAVVAALTFALRRQR